ncbi:polyunsaturated fatty acid lipoxygenase ALOX15B-like [Octopus sinensis]|uniref:Polyunsaturated fatty acid lipoxygenase ALOX15B-like n=2 Tax=Octopus sinensis TaxID=2607531 RepID=A0A7E6F278_9MOLL|nr:polyunsaturated fatty acid lipoxygenase ALOX15B-like [Octopus sinensis]
MQKYRDLYKLKYVGGFPLKLETLPRNEKDLIYTIRIELDVAETDIKGLYARLTIWTLEKLDDLNLIYSRSLLLQPKDSFMHWKEDTWFGYQRLNRCNPKSIRLCEEIPSKLGVDEAMMEPVLKGETLEGLIKKKRLFYTDLEILDGVIHRKEYDMCAPIALFMLNSNDDLTPIAIQLQQDKRQGNPVFLPTDDESVWTLAKMWYNMADANYHQSVVHMGLTHMLMQIVVAHMHRNIFPTHPLYKILAPHTYLLMFMNDFAFEKLMNPGAWVDQTMTIGSEGMIKLVCKGIQEWDFYRDGIPANDFTNRKVDDPKVLPKYYFRDDSLLLYDCVYKYVSSYIDLHYEKDEDVDGDGELQDWVENMSVPSRGGLKGLPMKDGKGHVSSKEDLKWIVSVIIFTCSVSHAAVNFLQYDEYGHPANYPSMLRTPLLKDKAPRTEKDIVDALPKVTTIFDVLKVTSVLSKRETNPLGNFDVKYICHQVGLQCVAEFQSNLKRITEEISEKIENRGWPYDVLDPPLIPNSIAV